MINKQQTDYSLYVCTDSGLMSCRTVEQSVEQAVKGGAGVIQLREKSMTAGEIYRLALRLRKITDSFGVPLIINDRADIALAAGCAGVHVGQKDLPCAQARMILGREAIIGVSAATVEEAVRAEQDGADYLGVGAMFPTGTKTDTRGVTPELLRQIKSAVGIPVVAIGGIKKNNLSVVKQAGADGIAVISAVLTQPDIESAAREIKQLWLGR